MTILAFVTDLFFLSRIDSAAEQLGLEVAYIEAAERVDPQPGAPDPARPGEALAGSDGALIRLIAERQPGLLIFDLNNNAVPWARWIALLKSSAATRRIPVLAFGSHMDVTAMAAAKNAGADQVLARSRFTSELPALIQKHLHTVDRAAVEDACRQPLSSLALEGIDLFNRGEYFEAHEVLEEAWNADASAGRELYRAILQVAVAYLQIERGNYRGAAKMFLRVRQWFAPLPDACRGVDVRHLRTAALAVEAELLRLGPEGLDELDRSLFLPIVLN